MKYVYKIVSAICALAVLPMLIFSEIIYYYLSSVAIQGLLGIAQLMGSNALQNAMERNELTSIPEGMADFLSIYEITDLAQRFAGDTTSDLIEKIDFMVPSFFATVAALVCIAVCAIVTAVFAIFCKDNRKVIASSFAGIGFSLLFVMLFDNTVAPIVSGQVNLATFLDSFFASLLGEIEILEITSTFYFVPIAFGFVALWTILYNATLPEKEKAERQKMIG